MPQRRRSRKGGAGREEEDSIRGFETGPPPPPPPTRGEGEKASMSVLFHPLSLGEGGRRITLSPVWLTDRHSSP
jgi:hypothetical protein